MVIQKRHHTRFFTEDKSLQDTVGTLNAQAGLVVDSGVSHPL